jgi:hypothetical protein
MDLELIRTPTDDDEHAASRMQTAPVTEHRRHTQMTAAADAIPPCNRSDDDDPVHELKRHRGPGDPSEFAQRSEDTQAPSAVHGRRPEGHGSPPSRTLQDR